MLIGHYIPLEMENHPKSFLPILSFLKIISYIQLSKTVLQRMHTKV